MKRLDLRVVTVSFEINGQLKVYTGLNVKARGCKFTDPTQNECEIEISNLDNDTVNYLLTETSPFNPDRTPKLIVLSAGREFAGTSVIFKGNITAVVPSQPPDITLTIKALTGNYLKGNIVARSQPPSVSLSTVAKQVAQDTTLALDFQATDKQLTNYNFTGGSLKQLQKLQEAGNVNVFVDNDNLIVKDYNVPLKNKVRVLNLDTGMIGIPEITEQGVKVKFLLDNQTVVGGGLQITSKIYPSINGLYTIFKLGFDITSRERPFYWIAEATRPGQTKLNKSQVISPARKK